MPVAEFERLVRQGLGRPIHYLKRGHDPGPYLDVIRRQGLEDWRFDSQEDRRGRYAVELLELAGLLIDVRPRILALIDGADLSDPDEVSWDLGQALDIAALLASGGDDEARVCLLGALGRNVTADLVPSPLFQHGVITDVISVAEVMGGSTVARDDAFRDAVGQALEAARWSLGPRHVGNMLVRAAAADERVAEFHAVGRAKRWRRRGSRRRPDRWWEVATFDEIGAMLRNERVWSSRGRLTMWGQRAANDQLDEAATALLAATDPIRLLNLLAVFVERSFPLDVGPIVELIRQAEQPARGYERSTRAEFIASTAARVLERVPGPTVRRLALELAERPGWEREAVGLLIANISAQDGDAALIASLMVRETDPDQRHRMTMDLRQLAKTSDDVSNGVADLLLLDYEIGWCGFCRRQTVELLIDRKGLPGWVAEECLWDANPETRQLVATGDGSRRA